MVSAPFSRMASSAAMAIMTKGLSLASHATVMAVKPIPPAGFSGGGPPGPQTRGEATQPAGAAPRDTGGRGGGGGGNRRGGGGGRGTPPPRGAPFPTPPARPVNRHYVYTGLTVIQGDQMVTQHECTTVTFRELEPEEISHYIATGEPMDKAGAYGIQGLGAMLVSGIEGDYFNVVGLPIFRLSRILAGFGLDLFQMADH